MQQKAHQCTLRTGWHVAATNHEGPYLPLGTTCWWRGWERELCRGQNGFWVDDSTVLYFESVGQLDLSLKTFPKCADWNKPTPASGFQQHICAPFVTSLWGAFSCTLATCFGCPAMLTKWVKSHLQMLPWVFFCFIYLFKILERRWPAAGSQLWSNLSVTPAIFCASCWLGTSFFLFFCLSANSFSAEMTLVSGYWLFLF